MESLIQRAVKNNNELKKMIEQKNYLILKKRPNSIFSFLLEMERDEDLKKRIFAPFEEEYSE